MAILYHTLQVTGGPERSLAAWGFELSSCEGERRSQAPDTWKGTIVTGNAQAADAFAFEVEVTIRAGRASASGADNSFSGGAVKFVGYRVVSRVKTPPTGTATTYEFRNAHYHLDNTQYKQFYAGSDYLFVPGENVLFTDYSAGSGRPGIVYITVGKQIQNVLAYAASVGAPLLVGAVDPQTMFPSLISKAQECSQTIDKCLELFPRTAEVWDYSTAPHPTVSYRFVDNLPSVTLPLFTGPDAAQVHKDLSITRRDDLVARAVCITYRITNSVDGVDQVDYAVDQWGPVMEAAYQAAGGDANATAANAAAQAVGGQAKYEAAFDAWVAGNPDDLVGAGLAGRAAVLAAVVAGTCDPTEGLRVPSELIDLAGFKVTTVKGSLDTEPLAGIGGTLAQRRAWWSSKRGGEQHGLVDSRVRFPLGDAGLPNLKLYYASAGQDSTGAAVAKDQEFTAADYSFFNRRVVRGAQCSWMTFGSPAVSVKSVKAQARVAMQYTSYDVPATGDALGHLPLAEAASDAATNGNVNEKPNTHEQHVNVELTNGPTGDYSTVASTVAGESYIIGVAAGLGDGIARYLWRALQAKQYEGDYIKVESSFANNVGPGFRVNLSGGRAEWLTMNAQVVGVRENYGTNVTSVSIGPARHLSGQQLSSMLNMWRTRQPWYNPALRANNALAGTGDVDMPETTGGANSTDGQKNHGQQQHIDYATPNDPTSAVGGVVNLNPNKVTTGLAATTPTPVDVTKDPKVVEPREVGFCDAAGNNVFAMVMVGGAYTKP